MNQKGVNSHIILPWMWDLACHPRIVGAVAMALKTDVVLLWESIIILRAPGKSGKEQTGIDWHADGGGYSKQLGPMEDFVTAFVALTPSTRESGCLEFWPESGGTDSIFLELQSGEFSLHSATVQHHAIR